MESCGSDVEGGAITVSGQACVDDGSRRLSDMPEGSFRLFMRRLGVLPQAWSGWATVYSHPHQVFLFSGCASFVGLSVSIVLALASKPFRWDHHGLCILNCTGHVVWFMMIWRLGPSAAKLYSYYAIVSLSVLASTVYSLRLMLGPLQYVPFRNLLAFVSLYAVELWLAMVPSQLGWWEPDLPSQPYKCGFCTHSAPCEMCFLLCTGNGKRTPLPVYLPFPAVSTVPYLLLSSAI